MSFLYKLQLFMARVMQGRNGPDNLSFAALIAAIAVSLLSSVLGLGLLSLLGIALYVYSIWRIFSRNVQKRTAENNRYVRESAQIRTKAKQFLLRVKNCRKYKYFRCPKCKVLIRLTRGCGEKQIHCPSCQHDFTMKA